MQPILRQFDIQQGDSVVTEESRDYAPDFILARFADSAGLIAPYLDGYRADNGVVSMVGTLPLRYGPATGFHTVPLLVAKNGNALAVAAERKVNGKSQRIVVTGDADFMSSGNWGAVNPTSGTSRWLRKCSAGLRMGISLSIPAPSVPKMRSTATIRASS